MNASEANAPESHDGVYHSVHRNFLFRIALTFRKRSLHEPVIWE